MKLEYTLTEQDYINFNLSFAETSDTVRKSMRKGQITGLIMFLILPFVLKNVSTLPFAYGMGIFGTLALLWFFFLPAFLKKNTIKQVKKMLQEKGDNFLGKKTLELRPDGIMTRGVEDETLTAYKAIEDITEYKGGVYLYTGPFSAIMINPSAFSSDQQRQDFIRELRTKANLQKAAPAKKSVFDKLDNL